MDSAKLIAFGVYHEDDLWDYLRGKNPYGLKRLALTLVPTYPSSGSENGLGAVSVDSRTGEATKTLQTNPEDMDARGAILLGASLSTSSRLGIGKESNYAYDIYELEFLPEQLFGSSYRRSLTSVFPRFLRVMGKHHADDIKKYFRDAFGFDSSIEESSRKLIELFAALGVEMYYDGSVSEEQIKQIPYDTELNDTEVIEMITEMIR